MIAVSVTKAHKDIPFSGAETKRVAEFVCKKENVKYAELSFVIIDDKTIRAINKTFLQHDYITDVITFPLEPGSTIAEIYINSQQAKRQAKENNVTFKNEMIRLIIHGTLHAIGYDDTTVIAKKKMDSIQERYVSKLSLI